MKMMIELTGEETLKVVNDRLKELNIVWSDIDKTIPELLSEIETHRDSLVEKVETINKCIEILNQIK